MSSPWHTLVEPPLRAIRPLFRVGRLGGLPLERTRPVRWLQSTVRSLRHRYGGAAPVSGVPRSVVLDDLRPTFNLESTEVGGKQLWLAAGIDPQLTADCRIRRGYAHLRIELHADVPARTELYLDTGHGFNARERFELGDFGRDVVLDGYLRLPRGVRQLRLDPVDRHGTFSLARFEVRHVSTATFWRDVLTTWYRERVGSIREAAALRTVGVLAGSAVYLRWRARTTSRARMRSIARRLETLAVKPKISVLVPVYNAPIPYLKRCIESVREQLYTNWELCVADDRSPDPEVRRVLESYARRDPRIKVVFREQNGNISACTNSALDLATGEYVALLDNDDEIEPHALALVALFINADPTVDVLYSDEDKIDVEGRHSDPFFKPDWSPDYYLCGNYISHLGVYRRSLVEEVGRFRTPFDGAQDYDLALRVFARTQNIRHIPDILYHWRTLPTSTAASTHAKPTAYEAGRSAIATALAARGASATVEHGRSPGYYRPRYDLPKLPSVSIIVPKRHVDQELLKSRTAYPQLEVVTSARAATGDVLIFASPSIQPRNATWVHELVSLVMQPGVGVVGAKVYDRNGRLSQTGLVVDGGVVRQPYLGFPGDFPGYNSTNFVVRNWSAVRDTCMAVKRSTFEQLGGFDAALGEQADADFCLRARKQGLRVAWTPYAEVMDLDPSAEHERGTPAAVREQLRSLQDADPYYNVNMTNTAPLFRVEARPATVLQ